MIPSIFLSIWITFPIFVGTFIPLSCFVFIYYLINFDIKLQVNLQVLFAVVLFFFYILVLSLFFEFHSKELLRYLDLIVVISLGKKFVYTLMRISNPLRLTIVFLPFFAFESYSQFNQNYPSVAIVLFIILLGNERNTLTNLLYIFVSIATSLYYKVLTALVGAIAYWMKLSIVRFIILFLIVVYILSFIVEEYPILRLYFSSALIRLDIWYATLIIYFTEFEFSNLLLGTTKVNHTYTNGYYAFFSGFHFEGLHPHNQFIFILFEYGIIGFILFIWIILMGVNTKTKLIKFLPLFAIFWFEASNDFMYFGLLSLIILLPNNGVSPYESLQKKSAI
jgi:hypothetical protein